MYNAYSIIEQINEGKGQLQQFLCGNHGDDLLASLKKLCKSSYYDII